MKNQALFSSKDKCRKLKCSLLQFLFGALRVKYKGILLLERFGNWNWNLTLTSSA